MSERKQLLKIVQEIIKPFNEQFDSILTEISVESMCDNHFEGFLTLKIEDINSKHYVLESYINTMVLHKIFKLMKKYVLLEYWMNYNEREDRHSFKLQVVLSNE